MGTAYIERWCLDCNRCPDSSGHDGLVLIATDGFGGIAILSYFWKKYTYYMIFEHVNRVLILAPHPDDAEFGLGGTISKLRERQGDFCYRF